MSDGKADASGEIALTITEEEGDHASVWVLVLIVLLVLVASVLIVLVAPRLGGIHRRVE